MIAIILENLYLVDFVFTFDTLVACDVVVTMFLLVVLAVSIEEQ